MSSHPSASAIWHTYRRLLRYSAAHSHMAGVAILAMVVDASCMTLFAKLIKPLLDRLFIDKDPSTIFWMPIWIIGIFVVRSFASFASDYAMAYVGRGVVYAIRNDVFRAYLYMPVDFCTTEGHGMQIARITYTCEQVAQAATDAVKTVLIDGLTVIGLVAVMIYYSPELALALLVMVPTIALIATRVSRSYRKVSQRVQIAMGAVTAVVSSAVNSYREIKTYGAQLYEKTAFLRSPSERSDSISKSPPPMRLQHRLCNAWRLVH